MMDGSSRHQNRRHHPRQCDLFDHFQRLWRIRVTGLDEELSTERYMKAVYVNRRALYKELVRTPPR